ncbi:hypothetical protein ACIGXI_10600 [Kitasatospora aureofaciens]|uniref:hypothetical protein n=1 Tax=Kitasatospora aureofaciens TaxID=1894 RepID=UPI0037C9C3A6
MSLDGNDHWQRLMARLLAVLAADPSDQLAWAGEHRVTTAAVADDVEFVLRLAEGMAERGTLGSDALHDLRTIDRLLGELDARTRAGRWADAPAADVIWSEARTAARRILTAELGDWHLPLPRRVPSPAVDVHPDVPSRVQDEGAHGSCS